MQRSVRVDRANGVPELEHERQVAIPLEDLERLGVVDAARCAERPALQTRIRARSGVEVALLLLEGGRQIRDLVAFDDALTGRRILAGRMRLEIEVRGARGLPDAGEIRAAAR